LVLKPMMASLPSNFEQRLERLEAKLDSTMREMREWFTAMNSRFGQLMQEQPTMPSPHPSQPKTPTNSSHNPFQLTPSPSYLAIATQTHSPLNRIFHKNSTHHCLKPKYSKPHLKNRNAIGTRTKFFLPTVSVWLKMEKQH